jgi:hypothetical protein
MLLLAFGLLPAQAGAQAAARCFPETGFCISGSIRSYWERNGGLSVFGYPISAVANQTVEGAWTGPVQWFERDRLEDHANEGVGVLAGRLGARLLELQGRPWQHGNDGPQPARNLCTFFPQTGYNACAPFGAYWARQGGLARFGYPITPAFQESVEGSVYLVQYFERRRMEYHPENAGTRYEVLLGLLGRDVFAYDGAGQVCSYVSPTLQRTLETYAPDLGCGVPYQSESTNLAFQPFERGQMIWLPRQDGGPSQIFVLTGTPSHGYSWQVFIDSYVEGEPVGTAELPPPGLYAPTRGFGKIWRTVPEVRDALGWGLEPEVGDSGVALQFSSRSGLSWMIYRASMDLVYILRANEGTATVVPRQR